MKFHELEIANLESDIQLLQRRIEQGEDDVQSLSLEMGQKMAVKGNHAKELKAFEAMVAVDLTYEKKYRTMSVLLPPNDLCLLPCELFPSLLTSSAGPRKAHVGVLETASHHRSQY